MKQKLAILFSVAFLDLLSFSLILPLFPYYAEHFGAAPFIEGALTAAYAVGQVIGAPVIGRLSDRYGRKPLLVLWSALFIVMRFPVGPRLARAEA